MSTSAVIGKVARRVATTFAIGIASLVPALLMGALGGRGGARPLIWICGAVFVTGLGWSLLPLVRHSRGGAFASLALWLAFGVYLCFFFGAESVRGWAAGPWLLASLVIGGVLTATPAHHSNSSEAKGEESYDQTSA